MQKEKSIKNLKLFLTVLFAFVLVAGIVLVIIFRETVIEVIKEILSGDDSLKNFMQSLGIGGYIILVLVQTIQFLIMGIPPEPIYFAAGISYGTIVGTLICLTGIVLGSQIIWAVYKVFKKSPRRRKKSIEMSGELEEKIKNSQKSIWAIMIAAYILPVVPFGLIAIVLINFKPKYWQYTIITLLGAILPVALSVFLGDKLASSSVHPAITLTILIVIMVAVIISLLNKNRIMNWLFKDKKTLDQKISAMKSKNPSRFLYWVFKRTVKKSVFDKTNAHISYQVDIKNLKPPFVVLINHPSVKDFAYAVTAMLPHRVTHVINRYFYHKPFVRKILHMIGTIPKKLYHADSKAMKEILRTVANGRAVGLAPEGINSINGKYMGLRPGIEKLIKHLNVPVILIKINGTFLTHSKWRKNEPPRVGRIDINVSQLFDKNDLAKLDNQEIFNRLDDALYYDEYVWAKENNIEFGGGNLASGLNRAIYLCPKCQSEFNLVTQGDTIECTKCHNKATLNKQFELIPFDKDCVVPQNPGEWYDLQRKTLYDMIESDDSFLMQSRVKLRMFNKSGKKEIEVGEGTLTLTHKGLSYVPISGKDIKLDIMTVSIPSVALNIAESIELYVGEEFYVFAFENGLHSVKWAIAIEQNFNFFESKKSES